MSEADTLLDSLGRDSVRLAGGFQEPHIAINSDRTITVPNELKRIAVQYDHNIETVTFDCPRYWDEHDLSKMKMFINYKTPNDILGSYTIDNISIDANDTEIIHFSWTIGGHVTQHKGTIMFLVCAKQVDDDGNESNHWNSEPNRDLFVVEGLECEESIIDQYPAIITQLLIKMNAVESSFHGGVVGGVYDQNSNKVFTAFIGTQKAWDNWGGNKENVMFFATDDTTIDDLVIKVNSMSTMLENLFATSDEVSAIFKDETVTENEGV